MNFELTVAGHTSPWRMQGSDAVSGWLRSRPWLELGGVMAAQAAPAQCEEVIAALRREALAADGGFSEVRVSRLRNEDLEFGVRHALEAWMEASPKTELDFLKMLGEALEVRPVLFLGWLGQPDRAGEALQVARQTAESVPKLGFRTGPTLLLLHARLSKGGTAAVLDRGGPVDLVALKNAPTEDVQTETAWRAYLHLRAAWEAGGDVERTLLLDTLRLGELLIGDDEGCERLLNQHARTVFAALPAREQDACVTRIEELMTGLSAQGSRGGLKASAPGLQGQGLALGEALPPWLARALLLEGRNPRARQLCGSRLVCTPLAELILTRCFELEALQRTRLSLDRLPETVPDDVRVRFDRFKGAGPNVERELYPADHPAPPNDAWAFATFGEFLDNVIGLRPTLRSSLVQLRLLRNAVAHGHYVGWKALQMLWRTEQALAGA